MTVRTAKKNAAEQLPEGFAVRLVNFLFEKPIGLGLWVGLLIGALNSYLFAWNIISGMVAGAVLGALTCTIACPAMRSTLKARKERIRQQKLVSAGRSRAVSAFTALE